MSRPASIYSQLTPTDTTALSEVLRESKRKGLLARTLSVEVIEKILACNLPWPPDPTRAKEYQILVPKLHLPRHR